MRSLSDTLERLARMRAAHPGQTESSNLEQLGHFGSNPGDLSGWRYVPTSLPSKPALVVVLHGCTQTAAGYDAGSGWSDLAEDYGFLVLYPEQVRANNANLCFNWFNADDIRRDHGEVMSIRQMISATSAEFDVDPRRIYITGLSAGGAMTNAMLACYPEVFAGGAIIAGLPYAAASSVPEAFDRMRGQGFPSTDALQARLQAASEHDGPWPTVSIWHGMSDTTVVPDNSTRILNQWIGAHDLPQQATSSTNHGGYSRSVWQDGDGSDAIELYRISGMAHGTPVDTASGYGKAAPFMLDVGLSSTVQIARSWGLAASFDRKERVRPVHVDEPSQAQPSFQHGTDHYIQSVIDSALRSAGLRK